MIRRLIILFLFFPALSILAQDNEQRAEAILAMAIQKVEEGGSLEEFTPMFEQAVKFSPSKVETYILWGTAITMYEEDNDKAELIESATDKFRMAALLQPDNALVHYTWAVSLLYYAKKTDNEELQTEAFDKLDMASKLTDENQDIYLIWADAMLEKARTDENTDSFRKSSQLYSKTLEKDANNMRAHWGKGYAYLSIGRQEKNLRKYRTEIETAFTRAEQLGSQSAAYNLACYYSLIKEKEEALKWLEKTIIKAPGYEMTMAVLDKARINDDKDFDNIRKDKRYKQLLEKYFGK